MLTVKCQFEQICLQISTVYVIQWENLWGKVTVKDCSIVAMQQWKNYSLWSSLSDWKVETDELEWNEWWIKWVFISMNTQHSHSYNLQTGSKLPWRDTAAHLVMRYQTPSQVPSGSESLVHIHVDSWLQQCTASFQPKLRPIFHGILASLKHTDYLWHKQWHIIWQMLIQIHGDSNCSAASAPHNWAVYVNCANTTSEFWMPPFNNINNAAFASKIENI